MGGGPKGKQCAVAGCKLRGSRMFSFPMDEDRRELWRLACGITKLVTNAMAVCSKHFSETDIYSVSNDDGSVKWRTRRAALPRLFLPNESSNPMPNPRPDTERVSAGHVRQKRRCCVPGCCLGTSDGVKTSNLPRNETRRKEWEAVCKLTQPASRHAVICSAHFQEDDYIVKDSGSRILKVGVVPSLRLPDDGRRDHSDHCSDAALDRSASPRTMFGLCSSDSDSSVDEDKGAPKTELVEQAMVENRAQGAAHGSSSGDKEETRKRKRQEGGGDLSFADKVDLVARSEAGELISKLCQDFSISRHAIYLILVNKAKYKKRGTTSNSKPRVIVPHDQLECATLLWFTQAVSLGQYMSGQGLLSKIEELNLLLGGDTNFQANDSWLKKFKNWHRDDDVVVMDIKNESPRSNIGAKKGTREPVFSDKIAMIDRVNLYSADELVMFWRALPESLLPEEKVHGLHGRLQPDPNRDRLTVLCCANSAGSHRLEPLIVGEQQQQPGEEATDHADLDLLPFSFVSRRTGYVDEDVIVDWFRNCFIPQVQERQAQDSLHGKVVLVLDRAACHPPAEVLNAMDPGFSVLYLPAEVPPQLQPLQQGAFEMFRRVYRLRLLERLALEEPVDCEAVLEFQLGLDHSEAVQMVAIAWDDVPPTDLALGWWDLLGASVYSADAHVTDTSEAAFIGILQALPGGGDLLSAKGLPRWLSCDKYEPVHRVMSDTDIAMAALRVAPAKARR